MIWLVSLLVLLAACGSDPDPGEATGPSSEECAQKRERLVEDVRLPLQIAADGMKYDGYLPRNGLGRVQVMLDTALASNCVGESAALDTLVDLAAKRPVTERVIQKADVAFDEWARSMGSPDARIKFPPPRPDPCPQTHKEVRASYRVIREPEVGGVRVSLDLVLENDGSKVIYLDHGGQVRATHVRPHDRTRTYYWGGSSADTARAFPGRTSTQRIELVPPNLHLFPGGRVEVFDLYGSAYSNVGPCPLKVSRIP
jgi:hypothetical protein